MQVQLQVSILTRFPEEKSEINSRCSNKEAALFCSNIPHIPRYTLFTRLQLFYIRRHFDVTPGDSSPQSPPEDAPKTTNQSRAVREGEKLSAGLHDHGWRQHGVSVLYLLTLWR